MPATRQGKISLVAAGVFLALLLVSAFATSFAVTETPNKVILDPSAVPYLIALGVLAFASSMVSLFSAIRSKVRYQERSLAVSLVIVFNVIVVFFLAGEFLIPH